LSMKKIIALLLALTMLVAFAGCNNTPDETKPNESTVPSTSEEPVKVMTHAEYMAADLDTPVVIETYVQGAQSWWENSAVIYCQDEVGGCLLYKITCTEDQFNQLKVGTKIRVTGHKAEYKGQIEIIDGTFEIIDGEYVAEPVDLSDKLSADDVIKYQTMLFAANGMTVAPIKDKDGNEAAFLYNWDGSGEQGSDLYFNVSINGETYNFCVESYLTGADTDVYKAVEALQIGQKINVEGFLYWYDGINPHITSVEPAVMTHAEYVAAPLDAPVVLETYVQGAQSWWDNSAVIYCQDEVGGCLLYKITCTEDQFNKLKTGTKIRVTGYKAEYKGQIEIIDGTFEIIDGEYAAQPVDLSDKLSADDVIKYQTMLFTAKNMTIEPIKDKDGKEHAFLYNWDGSGEQGSDLYFNVSINGATYNFCVESYLTGADTDVYKAVEALKVGDKIDVEGFLYWYDGINPHITSVKPVA